jgi:hypothetical protein
MSDERPRLIRQALGTKNLCFGGPSTAGSLRSASYKLVVRKPECLKHCIWELALHIAYWEYAVRRMLENGP